MAEPARKKIRTRSTTDYFLIGKSESRISETAHLKTAHLIRETNEKYLEIS